MYSIRSQKGAKIHRGSHARQACLVERENGLAENGTVRDDPLTCQRVPKLPALVITRVPNDNALGSMGGKHQMLVLLQMHICQATEGAQMRDIWLLAVEDFVRCQLSDRRRKANFPIEPVHCCIFPPNARKARLGEEGCNTF